MKKIMILLIICSLSIFSWGQSIGSFVVASAGESVGSGNLLVSWTLGEVAIETLSENPDYTLSQGFQQGFFQITSIGKPLYDNFSCKLYPVPALDFVWVDIESEIINEVIIQIYDLAGKLVYSEEISNTSDPYQIILTKFASSQYILCIKDNAGNTIQTYKLIKR